MEMVFSSSKRRLFVVVVIVIGSSSEVEFGFSNKECEGWRFVMGRIIWDGIFFFGSVRTKSNNLQRLDFCLSSILLTVFGFVKFCWDLGKCAKWERIKVKLLPSPPIPSPTHRCRCRVDRPVPIRHIPATVR